MAERSFPANALSGGKRLLHRLERPLRFRSSRLGNRSYERTVRRVVDAGYLVIFRALPFAADIEFRTLLRLILQGGHCHVDFPCLIIQKWASAVSDVTLETHQAD